LLVPANLAGAKPTLPPLPPKPDPTFYADIKVIAYRLPADEVRMADLRPNVTTNASNLDLTPLTDGDLSAPISLRPKYGEPQVWVQFEFPHPYRAQAITIAAASVPIFSGCTIAIPQGEVQSSENGSNWSTLVNLPGPREVTREFPVQTYSFPATEAKFYRVVLRPPSRPDGCTEGWEAAPGSQLPVPGSANLAEIELLGPRVNHWEGKAAFSGAYDFQSVATPSVSRNEVVPRHDVVDLTSRMRPDGTLAGDVPSGRWVILRLGYSLTGQRNNPATAEATGFEVDKLSAKHVSNYVKTYVDMASGAVGAYFGKSFRYFLMDSWEAGVENWTKGMIQEFEKRRGYDPTPYLPVLTGRIIESSEASDGFLWDFRRTIADLVAENHYGVATRYFNQHGMAFTRKRWV
jgi:hypothetical protein